MRVELKTHGRTFGYAELAPAEGADPLAELVEAMRDNRLFIVPAPEAGQDAPSEPVHVRPSRTKGKPRT